MYRGGSFIGTTATVCKHMLQLEHRELRKHVDKLAGLLKEAQLNIISLNSFIHDEVPPFVERPKHIVALPHFLVKEEEEIEDLFKNL